MPETSPSPRPPRQPALARVGRTLWFGLLFTLVAIMIALCGIPVRDRLLSRGPRLDPALPPEAGALARKALGTVKDGPDWRLVADIEAPWGEVLRLRPYVEGIEVRGADCVLHLKAEATPGSAGGPQGLPGRTADLSGAAASTALEVDPASVDWRRLREMAPGWKSAGGAAVRRAFGPVRESASPAGGGPGSNPARASARDSLALSSLFPAGTPLPFVRLRESAGSPMSLGLEIRLDLSGASPSLIGALEALPWEGERPEPAGPLDLGFTLDPQTLEITGVRDLRLTAASEARGWWSEAEGHGRVFASNPIAAGGGEGLRDGDPVDAYRVWETFPRLDGSGRLQGRWIATASGRPPTAESADLIYDYSSVDPRFEEAMAYYHGDRALEAVDTLGFHGLFAQPLVLRVHASELDNSWYSRVQHEVLYGDGGVDDAEDADIILHEIGHAIHDQLVPGFGDGDTRALSEGFGDFWAASLTGDPCVGEWDASAYSPPCLRRTDTDAVYTGALSGQPHKDGQIWSATLWDLRALLGAAGAERLALASFLEQGTATTFPEAALGLLRAAERLGLQGRMEEIQAILSRRGLIPSSFDFDLARGDTRTVELRAPARFLGRGVASLVLCGDGRLLFTPSSGPSPLAAFPEGPPSAVPCGFDSGPEGARVRVSGTLHSEEALLHQEWIDGGEAIARLDLVWRMAEGSLEWTYRDIRDQRLDLPFFAGVSSGGVPPDSLVSIRLESLPLPGIDHLRGFRGTFSGGNGAMIGARFEVTPDPRSSGFRLRRIASGIGVGDAPLVLEAAPNPFRDDVRLRVYLREPEALSIGIFDLSGRRVRSLERGPGESGVTTVAWDGRDDGGRRLAAGVYWARAASGGRQAQTRIVRIR